MKVILIFLCVVLVASPLLATTITVKSDATNVGASVASATDPRLASGDISGLAFSAVGIDNEGSFTAVPPGAPSGTIVVQVPPECGYYCGQSGFVMTTFTLPSTFSGISMTGAANVDDGGYAFLNGHVISTVFSEFGNTALGTNNESYFVSGVNTLVISDSNSGGGPSAVAFYADITYSATATPEPSTMLTLVSGVLGLAGLARKRLFS